MNRRTSVATFRRAAAEGRLLTILTAYDYSTAKILDAAGIDAILVGDSLGMVVQGHDTTIPVTMDHMVYHTQCVARGTQRALVIADLPFLAYTDAASGVRNAGRLVQEGGAQAVKVEGGADTVDVVRAIVAAHIPVMAHLGLTPQSVHELGGFSVQARREQQITTLIDDARRLESAGAFALVLEAIPGQVAKIVTEAISIPTIGIGAGPHCAGQVLVSNDMLGLYDDLAPKFVKRYADLGQQITRAVENYITDVTNGSFPAEEHTFSVSEDVVKKLY